MKKVQIGNKISLNYSSAGEDGIGQISIWGIKGEESEHSKPDLFKRIKKELQIAEQKILQKDVSIILLNPEGVYRVWGEKGLKELKEDHHYIPLSLYEEEKLRKYPFSIHAGIKIINHPEFEMARKIPLILEGEINKNKVYDFINLNNPQQCKIYCAGQKYEVNYQMDNTTQTGSLEINGQIYLFSLLETDENLKNE